MHLDFVRPSGQWAPEMVPGAGDFQRMDFYQSRVINGDGGGLWTPSKPVIIGGHGMTFTTAPTAFTGPVSTATGGRVQVAGSTFPPWNGPSIDAQVMSALGMLTPLFSLSAGSASLLEDDYVTISDAPNPVGVSSVSGGLSQPGLLSIPSRYLHQGASFSSITLTFAVRSKPSSAALPGLAFTPYGYNAGTNSFAAFAPSGDLSTNGFTVWAASTPYAVGAYVIPYQGAPGGTQNGFWYKATAITTGISGGTEPVWPLIIGNTVLDGGVTWTCGGSVGALDAGLSAAVFFANGAPQSLTLQFDNSSPTLLAANAIDHSQWVYGLLIGGIGDVSQLAASVNISLYAVQFDFANITALSFP